MNFFAKSTFPAAHSQIAHLKRQTGERSGEVLREKHFTGRISTRFPNPAFILEIFWKNTCHLPVQPQISTRFPNTSFILEIFWKSTAMPPAPHKRIGSNRFNPQFDPILLSVSCLTLGHLPAGRQISPPIRTCPPQEIPQEPPQDTNQEPPQDTDPLLASIDTVAPSVKSLVQFSHDRIAGISSAMATVAA